MSEYWLNQLEFVFRLVLAAGCGALIGFERKNRLKEAGVRTHLIVSLGSALIMIVSKYGFFDLMQYGMAQDPARVAAQIVSGISFLGAGMIFTRNESISGLTTAAGIWATAAVGMSIGAGLYLIAVATTIFILLAQFVFHQGAKWMRQPATGKLHIEIANSDSELQKLKEKLEAQHIEVISMKGQKNDSEKVQMVLRVKLPVELKTLDLAALLEQPEITKVEM